MNRQPVPSRTRGRRRKGIHWEYNGDGRFRSERYTAADKRYWRRWLRRVTGE